MFTRTNILDVCYFLLDKMDPKSLKRLKAIVNKWRGKSIFQLVMMDRSNKLQEVVYFSLQVI